jgi:hypothetical protein
MNTRLDRAKDGRAAAIERSASLGFLSVFANPICRLSSRRQRIADAGIGCNAQLVGCAL